ncbi:MAG: hypothetical protein V4436_02955 [Patescibacteria group bacterium]
MRLILAAAFLFLASLSSASAATKEDIGKLVGYLTNAHQPKKILLHTVYDTALDEVQVVFVQDGKRYSIFFSGTEWSAGNPIPVEEQWITVSVRPNGTSGPETVDGFEDMGLDGMVDEGSLKLTPLYNRLDESRKIFDNGSFTKDLSNPLAPVGMQFEAYWQERYDEAIRDALKFYGTK